MKSFFRKSWLISKTIWTEAVRSKEIYAIVIIAVILIIATRSIRFFDIEGLSKFYREVALRIVNLATSFTVILLASRQFPREFENRTLYPMLGKPVGRWNFLFGKYLGVMLAAGFCYALFIGVFLLGQISTGAPLNWVLFGQFVYLQILNFSILTSLAYLLSLLFNIDAAITLCSIIYLFSQVFLSMMSYLYDFLGAFEKKCLLILHYVMPQLTLFDASAKVVHSLPGAGGESMSWPSLAPWAMAQLTLYAVIYTGLYLGGSYFVLRRKAL